MKPKFYHITLGLFLTVGLFLSAGLVTAQDTAEPQRATILQYAVSERPVLAELLTIAGLAPTLSGSTPYTLLAPPEASLQPLKGQSADKIRATLAMHVIKGKYKEADFKEGAKIENYSGGVVNVCRKKGQTLINGVRITAADKEMRNGMVQEVGSLLVP